MLDDFLSLENMFGRQQAAIFIDDLLARYSVQDVTHALEEGLVERRMICIGPDCGRCVCYLSDKGRQIACAQVC